MHFSCDKKTFENNVNAAANASLPKSNVPALECLYLKAQNNSIELLGNNLELAILSVMECENIVLEGEILIKSVLLTEALRQMPDGQLAVKKTEDNILDLKCGNTSYSVICLEAEQFPNVERISSDELIEMPSIKLKNAIKGVAHAVAVLDTRPILKGIFMECRGDMAYFTALDGTRLAHHRIKLESNSSTLKVVFSNRTLNELSKLLKDDETSVRIQVSNHHCMIESNNITMYARLLEGDFMDYRRILDARISMSFVVNTKELIKCIASSAPLLQFDDYKMPVVLDIKNNILVAQSKTKHGTNVDEIAVEGEGEITIAFRMPLLLDALKSKNDEFITISFHNNLSPVVIKPVEGDEFIEIILPVRMFE